MDTYPALSGTADLNHTKSTKSGVLFSTLLRSAERTLRNEGRTGEN